MSSVTLLHLRFLLAYAITGIAVHYIWLGIERRDPSSRSGLAADARPLWITILYAGGPLWCLGIVLTGIAHLPKLIRYWFFVHRMDRRLQDRFRFLRLQLFVSCEVCGKPASVQLSGDEEPLSLKVACSAECWSSLRKRILDEEKEAGENLRRQGPRNHEHLHR